MNTLFWLKCLGRKEKRGKLALLCCPYCVSEEKSCEVVAVRGMDQTADQLPYLILHVYLVNSWRSRLLNLVFWCSFTRWIVFPNDSRVILILTGNCACLFGQPPLPFFLSYALYSVRNSCCVFYTRCISVFFSHLSCSFLEINCCSWEDCTFVVWLR